MANRVWDGGAGDWTDPARWTAADTGAEGAPQPGDGAVVPGGSVTLLGSEGLDGFLFDGVALTLGDANDDPTALNLSGAYLGNFFPIQAAGSATIAAQGASGIAGAVRSAGAGTVLTLAGDAANPNGLVLANGSSVSVQAGATLVLRGLITAETPGNLRTVAGSTVENDATVRVIGSGFNVADALTGTGVIDVEDGSTVQLGGAVSAGQTVTFGDVDGRLQVAQPGAFAGAVTGFGPGDIIDFTTSNAAAAAYDAASRTLTLTGADGSTVATLQNVQAAAGALKVSADPGGTGTAVSYVGAPARRKYQIADGDRAMKSDVVRATLTVPGTATPITGAGVKVGIISTSFNLDGLADQDAAAGYLPANPDGTSAVDVLREGSAGDDEGRAMAELIHQAAPGAQLYFAAAGNSQSGFASSVAALAQAGCRVIADDITFNATPFYQVAGGLDQAVSAAVAGGASFFTSGGNFGRAYLESAFTPQAAALAGVDGTQQAEIFSGGTPYERITIPANTSTRIDLQSTAPYEGVNGAGAPPDLALKIYDANGDPIQGGTGATSRQDGTTTTDVYYTLPTATAATDYRLAVYLNGGQVSPAGFKLILSAGGGGTGPGGIVDDPLAGQGSGDERGQQLIPGVNSVGATSFANSAAFGGAPGFDEYFSSPGPGTLLYDAAGNPLPSPQSAGKVDFDAPDGIDTTVPGFAPFYGTSAAAPDAAAVAALMLQANPGLTTAQVTALLERSAVSQGLPSDQQGAGLIQADRAVALAIAALSPVLAVSLSPGVAYAGGAFTVSGTASASDGLRSVEISAVVGGVRQDLGAAALGPNGTFTFRDAVGPQPQSALRATLTDVGGSQAASADPGLTLTGGLGPTRGAGRAALSGPAGPLSTAVYGPDGGRSLTVDAPGQTVALQPSDVVLGRGRGGTSFVYAPGSETGVVDVIRGFTLGGTDHDTLALPSADFADLADLLRHTGDIGGSAFVTDPKTGDAIRLAGVTTAELKAHGGDVAFHA